jgi:hypothetical protein
VPEFGCADDQLRAAIGNRECDGEPLDGHLGNI